MKYRIIVEKENEKLYVAYCPVMTDIRASGDTMSLALSNIKTEILCYLHDAEAEFEIVFDGRGTPGGRGNAGRQFDLRGIL